jgi:hypothetical protein
MPIQLKSQNVTNMYTPIELVTTNVALVGGNTGGGVTDHGYLHGLGDNDHPQYLLSSRSSLLIPVANSSIFQPVSNSSLSLGTGATVSFEHTSASTKFIAFTNSSLLQPVSNSTLSLAKSESSLFINLSNSTKWALSDHSHGNVNVASVTGTQITAASASTGLTLGVPNFLTTAYGAGLKGSGSYVQNTGTIEFSNANGVTFGLGTDGIMTASIPAIGGAQTGISSIYDGNSSVVTQGAIKFNNSNGISFGFNGSTLTASYSTHVFSNSNNVEFGTNGSTVTALALFNQTLQTSNVHNISLDTNGNTSGTVAEISSGTLTLAGGNNITLSQSGNKVVIVGPSTLPGGVAASIAGNSTSSGSGYSNITSGTLYLAGGNNITLSQDGAHITISGANIGGAQTGISGIGASDRTYSSGTVIWSGQNNITIGTYATGDSQYVRLSVGNYLTTAAQSDHTHSQYQSTGAYLTTAMQSASSSVFAKTGFSSQSTTGTDIVGTLNTSGLNLGVPKWLTTAAVSTHIHGNVSLSLTNLSGTYSSASDGLTLSMTGYPATSFVNVSNYTPAYFSNSNGVTFGSSINGVSTTVTANMGIGSVYMADSLGSNITWGSSATGSSTYIYATAGGGTGAYAGQGFTTTATAGTAVVGTLNASGLKLGVPAFLTTAGTGGAANLTVSASNTSATLDKIVFSNSNNVSFGLSGSTLTASIPAASINFSDANGITWGSSVNGSSTTITASFSGGGSGAGAALKGSGTYSQNSGTIEFANSNSITFGLTNNQMTASFARGNVYFSDGTGIVFGSSTNGVSTTITGSITQGYYLSGNNTAGTTSWTGGQNVTLSGGNNITLSGNSNGQIVISAANAGGAQTGVSGIGVSDTTYSSGTIIFSNQSNITIGSSVNGASQYVRLSVADAMLTGERANLQYTSANSKFISKWSLVGNTSGTNTQNISDQIYFSGGNNVTLSGNGSTIVISGNQPPDLHGIGVVGCIVTNNTFYFSNENSISFGLNGSTMTASFSQSTHDHTTLMGLNTAVTGASMTGNSSGMSLNIPQGSLYFNDSNGIVFGGSSNGLSTTITGSLGQVWNLLSNTAGTSSYSFGSNLKLAGGANITLSGGSDGVSIVGAAAGTGAGIAASIGGNSTSAGAGYSNITAGTMVLAGGNNITLSQNGANITISGANVGGAQTGISGFGDSQTTFSSGTVLLSAYSNISLITSVNGASQYVKLSVPDFIGLRSSTRFVGINTSSSSTNGANLAFSMNSSGATFSVPAWLTTYAAQTAEPRVVSVNGTSGSLSFNAGTFMSLSQNGSAFTWAVTDTSAITANAVNTSVSSKFASKWSFVGGNTAGTTTGAISDGVLYLSGGNMLTLSGNTSTIILSVNTASLVGTGALGSLQYTSDNTKFFQGYSLEGVQTAGSTVSGSASRIYLSGGNMMTLSGNQNTIVFSVNTASLVGTGALGSLQYTSANTKFASKWSLVGNNTAGTTTQNISDIIYLSGDNMMTLSADASTIKFSVNTASLVGTGALGSLQYTSANTKFFQGYSLVGNNTAGSTVSGSGSQIYLSGGNNITLSGNQNTIVISAANAAAGAISISAGASTNTYNSLVFSNSNSVSFGLNGSTMTASVARGNVYYSDNASATWSSSVDGVSTSIYVGSLPSRVISLNGTSGVLSFSGGNNITISALNGSTFSIHGPSSLLYALSLSGNSGTTGSNGIANSGFVLAGGNNISLSQSNNTISIIGGAGGGGVAIAGSAASTVTGGTMQFVNSNNVSFGLNGSTMTASIPAASIYFSDNASVSWSSSTDGSSTSIYVGSMAGGGGGVAVAGSGASTVTSGTMQFANSNGFSFGLNGSTMTLSGAYAGTGTSVTGNASITHGTGGIAFNGSGLAGTNTAITGSIAITVNSSGVSVNASSLAGVGTTITTTSGTDYKVTLNSAGLNFAAPYGYMFFGNSNGHSWTSSTNGVSTTFYLVT